MGVQLQREVGNTGLVADHWVVVAVHIVRQPAPSNDFTISGTMQAWKDSTEYGAGKEPVRGLRVSVDGGLVTGNPTAAAMETLIEDAAIAVGGPLEGGLKV